MAYTISSDISRMLTATNKEVFMENFNAFPLEYPEFTTKKTSTKETEYYDSMGNIGSGGQKVEGDAIAYKKITQAYQTSCKNLTWANGFEVSLESIKYDRDGVMDGAKAKELARTMRELEETRAIKRIDEAFTTNLVDGVPLCSNSKPLVNCPGTFNDTLATASALTTPANHKTMINMFFDFKNQAGGKMKSYPTDGLTHFQNMLDIEEIYGSANKANEISNTKNVLPKIKWHYSTYISGTNDWFIWDNKFEHVIFQWFMETNFDQDEDKISTKNIYYNAIAMYETATLPNIGIVGNQGS